MQIKWKKLIISLLIWLTSEILLNFAGIDDLVDYGEFVFERHYFNKIPVNFIVY